MAGEWIKMRGNLWDDPRVARLCDLTDSTEAAVIGALYWLWASADQHTEDGCMPGLSLRQIDRKTGVPGIGAALCQIGWLVDGPDGVVITRFSEHNGASAKSRSVDAKRKADGRGSSGSSKDKGQTKTGRKADASPKQSAERPESVRVATGQDADTTRMDPGGNSELEKEKSINTPIPPEADASGGSGPQASPGDDSPGSGDAGEGEEVGRTGAVALPVWLARCQAAGVLPLPAGCEPLQYAESIGLPGDVMQAHWAEFKARHSHDGAKRYSDWPATLLRSLRGNWYGIWRVTPGGGVEVTSAGNQAMLAHGLGPDLGGQAA